ncbi:MAG: hypothetical protein A3G87_01790 [Omnitrophica bacterium RIFCSPLOWO2_12_FULL_50_11]|nr:MAG: hypothetical protein A3G87_01790 [Omnitrophica bacterium RIFCSPLOWO2_12_FULL_50_11]
MAETKWIPMTVTEVHQETEQMVSLRMQPSVDHVQFDFRTGQYVKILCPGGREAYFAIASNPEEKKFIEFLVKDVEGSPAHDLSQVKPDDELRVSTPMGKGFPLERLKGKNVLLVGMGSGLSPLRSVMKSIHRRKQDFGKVVLVYGVRRPEDVPFIDDFNLWGMKIRVEIAASQPGKSYWSGFEGRVTELLPKLALSYEKMVACVCGSKEMEEEVAKFLESVGMPKENILFNY